ncbi:antirestriction protein ArdA [Kribbella sp. NBC_01505]|uniref:antirestriction protein ArdA n=1 Tax=Kribbella sp. NBC_01505 TaxID=2903580 RepID=UPI00386DEBFD
MADARVWVGCLGCHNEGYLAGQWFDAGDAPEEVAGEDSFNARLHGDWFPVSPWHYSDAHEELWVMDTDGMPVDREMSPYEANQIGAKLDEIEESNLSVEAVMIYAEWTGDAFVEVKLDAAQAAYEGEWRSEVDFARWWAEETGALPAEPDWPTNYIDWESATLDLMQTFHAAEDSSGMVHIFWAC